MNEHVSVFQDGSNCATERLNNPKRPNGHAEDRGLAQTVEDFQIAFTVYSECNKCATADLSPTPSQKVWGVLFEIADEFIRGAHTDGHRTLKRIEGKKYRECEIDVKTARGEAVKAVTFVVRNPDKQYPTSAEYVGWIVEGLRVHNAPEEYIEHIRRVAAEHNKHVGGADEVVAAILRLTIGYRVT